MSNEARTDVNLTTNRSKNVVELKKEINAQGVTLDTIYVNDRPFTQIGYISEADKEACVKAVQTAVDSSCSLAEAQRKLAQACQLGYYGIDPDEQIEVDGYDVMLSYKEKKAYIGVEEVANLDDLNLPAVGKDVVKALLTDRVKLRIANKFTK